MVPYSTNIRGELVEPMNTNEMHEVPVTHAGGQAGEGPGELHTVREAEEL